MLCNHIYSAIKVCFPYNLVIILNVTDSTAHVYAHSNIPKIHIAFLL